MRVALAQINPVVGDIVGNEARVRAALEAGVRDGALAVVTAELALVGYPPRDLLLREGVVEACEAAVARLAAETRDTALVVGHPRRAGAGEHGLRNSVSVCRQGTVVATYDKQLLPGYDVFDEDRYFDRGTERVVVELGGGVRAGVLVCEDLWQAADVVASPHYATDPLAGLAASCDLVLCPTASPFIAGKFARQLGLLTEAARRHGLPIVTVNQVGANDDLVFDGRGVAVGADGHVAAVLPGWVESVQTIDLATQCTPPTIDDDADLWHALVLAVRDYVRKTRHERVVLGLSGGIDSALVATIAAAALGPRHVTGLLLPSRHSSQGSREDARALAGALGLGACIELPIEAAHTTLSSTLEPALDGAPQGLADENLQARIRGILLMAHANQTGSLLLATSNKSELAVGYSTLYGDMCGALAVLGDVPKTRVYDLARWINAHPEAGGFARAPIPEASITKPPSAELRPDQTDQDSLPPYDLLDAIIERYVDLEQSVERIVEETGQEHAFVLDLARRIDRAEFKRFQAPIAPKVTSRAFGRGRPWPLVMR